MFWLTEWLKLTDTDDDEYQVCPFMTPPKTVCMKWNKMNERLHKNISHGNVNIEMVTELKQ